MFAPSTAAVNYDGYLALLRCVDSTPKSVLLDVGRLDDAGELQGVRNLLVPGLTVSDSASLRIRFNAAGDALLLITDKAACVVDLPVVEHVKPCVKACILPAKFEF